MDGRDTMSTRTRKADKHVSTCLSARPTETTAVRTWPPDPPPRTRRSAPAPCRAAAPPPATPNSPRCAIRRRPSAAARSAATDIMPASSDARATIADHRASSASTAAGDGTESRMRGCLHANTVCLVTPNRTDPFSPPRWSMSVIRRNRAFPPSGPSGRGNDAPHGRPAAARRPAAILDATPSAREAHNPGRAPPNRNRRRTSRA